jgi:hypothetical protein
MFLLRAFLVFTLSCLISGETVASLTGVQILERYADDTLITPTTLAEQTHIKTKASLAVILLATGKLPICKDLGSLPTNITRKDIGPVRRFMNPPSPWVIAKHFGFSKTVKADSIVKTLYFQIMMTAFQLNVDIRNILITSPSGTHLSLLLELLNTLEGKTTTINPFFDTDLDAKRAGSTTGFRAFFSRIQAKIPKEEKESKRSGNVVDKDTLTTGSGRDPDKETKENKGEEQETKYDESDLKRAPLDRVDARYLTNPSNPKGPPAIGIATDDLDAWALLEWTRTTTNFRYGPSLDPKGAPTVEVTLSTGPRYFFPTALEASEFLERFLDEAFPGATSGTQVNLMANNIRYRLGYCTKLDPETYTGLFQACLEHAFAIGSRLIAINFIDAFKYPKEYPPKVDYKPDTNVVNVAYYLPWLYHQSIPPSPFSPPIVRKTLTLLLPEYSLQYLIDHDVAISYKGLAPFSLDFTSDVHDPNTSIFLGSENFALTRPVIDSRIGKHTNSLAKLGMHGYGKTFFQEYQRVIDSVFKVTDDLICLLPSIIYNQSPQILLMRWDSIKDSMTLAGEIHLKKLGFGDTWANQLIKGPNGDIFALLTGERATEILELDFTGSAVKLANTIRCRHRVTSKNKGDNIIRPTFIVTRKGHLVVAGTTGTTLDSNPDIIMIVDLITRTHISTVSLGAGAVVEEILYFPDYNRLQIGAGIKEDPEKTQTIVNLRFLPDEVQEDGLTLFLNALAEAALAATKAT